LAGVTEIVGAPLGKLTLVAPDFANVWTLDGPNSGILTAGKPGADRLHTTSTSLSVAGAMTGSWSSAGDGPAVV
jgi:hypothetical protein